VAQRSRARTARARGGVQITELTWRAGALSRVVLRASLDGPCTVRLGERTVTLTLKAGETAAFDGKLERIVGFDG